MEYQLLSNQCLAIKKRTKSLSLGFVIRSSINKFLYINESYSMSKRLEDSRGYSYKMQLCEMYFSFLTTVISSESPAWYFFYYCFQLIHRFYRFVLDRINCIFLLEERGIQINLLYFYILFFSFECASQKAASVMVNCLHV